MLSVLINPFPAPEISTFVITSCDLSEIAHSETAQAVRVRILVRVASSVVHQSPGNASDPKTPTVRGSAKLPPLQ